MVNIIFFISLSQENSPLSHTFSPHSLITSLRTGFINSKLAQ